MSLQLAQAWRGTKEVLAQRRYAVACAAIFCLVFATAMLMPHYRLIGFAFRSPILSFGVKLKTLGDLFVLTLTTFSPVIIAIAFVIALTFAVNAALGTYYVRHRLPVGQTAAASVAGLFFGLLGLGCASCGSVLLSAFVGSASLGFLSVLPLRGIEFGLIGAAISVGATYVTAKKIADPAVCALPSRHV